MEVFADGAAAFDSCVLAHGGWKPDPADNRMKTNAEAYDHAKRFAAYVRDCGRRGTPHSA